MESDLSLEHKLIPVQTIITAITAVGIAVSFLLWIMATFQTRADYNEDRHAVEARFDRQKDFMLKIDDKLDHIQEDLSLIKGQLIHK